LLMMPVMSNDMLNNRWELRRIVHDMLRRKQHALEQPLPRERRADGNHVHPCRQGCLYAGGRVFEDEAICRWNAKFACNQHIYLRVGLAVLDVVARSNEVEG